MAALITAGILMVVGHIVPSAPGVRAWLIERFGRPVFMAAYSVLSLGLLVFFCVSYVGVTDFVPLYSPIPFAHQILLVAMPLPIFMIVCRLSDPFGDIAAPKTPRGIYCLTRAPGSVGLLIWAGLHLAATGDMKRVVTFLVLGAIPALTLLKNERLLRSSSDSVAVAFVSTTSIIPMRATSMGGVRIAMSQIGVRPVLITALVYLVLIFAHGPLLGVSPLT